MRQLLYVALLSTVSPIAAHAQSEQSREPEVSETGPNIVVTALRRNQQLQDVPIAITAISGDALNELGMDDSADIAAQVPNLTIKESFANSVPQIFLRGVGINDPNANANGAVGIYVDGVNLVSPSALTFSLYDTERVEVLRGPQGTLYGRNTTGGAINFISRKPEFTTSGLVTGSIGRFDSRSVEAAVNVPASSNLAIRTSGVWDESDGFHFNRVTQEDMADLGRWSGRVQLRYQPGNDLDILLNVHGGRVDNKSTPFEHEGTVDPETFEACDYRFEVCTDYLGYTDTDGTPYAHDIDNVGHTNFHNFGTSLQVEARIGAVTLNSITAYERARRKHREDADASPNTVLDTSFQDLNKQFSQELRLTSPDDGRVKWIVGGFYSEEDTDLTNTYDFFRGYRDVVEDAGFPGGFDPDGASGLGYTPFYIVQDFVQKAHSYAAFANVDLQVSDTIELTFGARYTSEDRAIRTNVAFVEPDFDIPLVDDFSDKVDFDSFSGKAGINFTPSDNLLIYASASRGFKSGGFNGALVFSAPELQPFDPETLWAYEVGFKSQPFGRGFTLNGAAFYYDYKNLQLYTFTSVGGIPTQLLTNAGSAEIYGAELEMAARPFENFNLSAGLGLLHTEIKEFDTLGDDFVGNRLVLAPEVTGNVLASYKIPLDGLGFDLGLQTDARYQSKVYFSTSNSPLLAQDGYMLLNARVSLGKPDDSLELAAQVKNITNKRYITEAFDFSSSGWNLYVYGRPCTWEVSATARF